VRDLMATSSPEEIDGLAGPGLEWLPEIIF